MALRGSFGILWCALCPALADYGISCPALVSSGLPWLALGILLGILWLALVCLMVCYGYALVCLIAGYALMMSCIPDKFFGIKT